VKNMCGICGIVDFKNSRINPAALDKMTGTLKHRGPDDNGTEILGPAGLGHTRLSVIDLTSAAHQPMLSDDRRIALTYNGEVYNFLEIREKLEQKGTHFRSRSDTEVILRAYIEWGTDCFAMFNGMFAFAVWDARTATLYLVRDRYGIKPVYYTLIDGGIIFGSEIKAILASGLIDRAISWKCLHEYLYYGYGLGANTLFERVLKLQAGHYLMFSNDKCEDKSYWSIDEIEPVLDSAEIATEKVRNLLEKAVRDHLVSDVPVGVFLSGGIDSSAITAFASKHYKGRIKTYSVGFDYEKKFNELPMAARVAKKFGTDHHELHVKAGNIPSIIECLVRAHDEPFGDAADIPLYLLCESLKGSIKVILQGDGGDELFGGYIRYNIMAHQSLWRTISQLGLLPLGLLGKTRENFLVLKRLAGRLTQTEPIMRMALFLTMETLDNPPTRLLSSEAREKIGGHNPFHRYYELYGPLKHLDPAQKMIYMDFLIHLPDCFFEKVDKATMAHGIEIRVPFLDANLTRYALGLPSNMKVRLRKTKWIVRRALRGILPDVVLNAKKRGFGVPFSRWLREPLAGYMKEVLLDSANLKCGLFDRDALEKCIQEHTSGHRDNGCLLYKTLNLALWRQFYADRTAN
jgi:asparagine synthase (glutamine-hydrolysing)